MGKMVKWTGVSQDVKYSVYQILVQNIDPGHLHINFVLNFTFGYKPNWLLTSVFLISGNRESNWVTHKGHNDPSLSDSRGSVGREEPTKLSVLFFLNGVFDIRRWHFVVIIKYQHHWTVSWVLFREIGSMILHGRSLFISGPPKSNHQSHCDPTPPWD